MIEGTNTRQRRRDMQEHTGNTTDLQTHLQRWLANANISNQPGAVKAMFKANNPFLSPETLPVL